MRSANTSRPVTWYLPAQTGRAGLSLVANVGSQSKVASLAEKWTLSEHNQRSLLGITAREVVRLTVAAGSQQSQMYHTEKEN